MDSAIAGLIGAVLGACVVIVNSLITNRHQLNLEKEKARLTTQTEYAQELRSRIADVALEMLSAQHAMEWVSWFAAQGANVNAQMISNYHHEIHLHFPKLLGNLAVVASLNANVYEQLARLAERLYEVDSQIAVAMLSHEKEPNKLSEKLTAVYSDACALYQLLPKELSAVMNSVRM